MDQPMEVLNINMQSPTKKELNWSAESKVGGSDEDRL